MTRYALILAYINDNYNQVLVTNGRTGGPGGCIKFPKLMFRKIKIEVTHAT